MNGFDPEACVREGDELLRCWLSLPERERDQFLQAINKVRCEVYRCMTADEYRWPLEVRVVMG